MAAKGITFGLELKEVFMGRFCGNFLTIVIDGWYDH